jgi:hypothetical protein
MRTVVWEADIQEVSGKSVAIMSFFEATPKDDAEDSGAGPLVHNIVAASGPATHPAGTADVPQPGMVPWLDVFEPLAYKLHVVVTIENDRRASLARMPVFDVRFVTPPSTQPSTPDALSETRCGVVSHGRHNCRARPCWLGAFERQLIAECEQG